MRLHNLDVQCTKHKMGEMLQKADLEGHGYIKEVTTKVVKGPPSSGTDLQQVCADKIARIPFHLAI